ncbi:hypothetical protein SAMN05421676_102335 [Salinibacillus kushneri]|uniref:Uncharacterized protein n=1 Tax=Salinibacillus kushneri TaxID=237682 RepID=A0A1I0B2X2_9BACI|nr:hypothetical protein SAMN05421676_102335 [Salinibacillus kushneri]
MLLRVKVNDFQFSAVPVTDKIIVSEISSGARFFETPIPKEVKGFESTMTFLEISIGARILMIIKKLGGRSYAKGSQTFKRVCC